MKYKRSRLLQLSVVTLILTGALAGLTSGADEPMTPLQVAYAGSMGSMMDGGIRPAIAIASSRSLASIR